MTKKNFAVMSLVNIENGKTIPTALPVNRPAKPAKGKKAKPPAAITTYALEPKQAKVSIGEKLNRTPDEMFERVTSGLIQLDHTKRMQAISSILLTYTLRSLVVMMIFCVVFVILAQFS